MDDSYTLDICKSVEMDNIQNGIIISFEHEIEIPKSTKLCFHFSLEHDHCHLILNISPNFKVKEDYLCNISIQLQNINTSDNFLIDRNVIFTANKNLAKIEFPFQFSALQSLGFLFFNQLHFQIHLFHSNMNNQIGFTEDPEFAPYVGLLPSSEFPHANSFLQVFYHLPILKKFILEISSSTRALFLQKYLGYLYCGYSCVPTMDIDSEFILNCKFFQNPVEIQNQEENHITAIHYDHCMFFINAVQYSLYDAAIEFDPQSYLGNFFKEEFSDEKINNIAAVIAFQFRLGFSNIPFSFKNFYLSAFIVQKPNRYAAILLKNDRWVLFDDDNVTYINNPSDYFIKTKVVFYTQKKLSEITFSSFPDNHLYEALNNIESNNPRNRVFSIFSANEYQESIKNYSYSFVGYKTFGLDPRTSTTSDLYRIISQRFYPGKSISVYLGSIDEGPLVYINPTIPSNLNTFKGDTIFIDFKNINPDPFKVIVFSFDPSPADEFPYNPFKYIGDFGVTEKATIDDLNKIVVSSLPSLENEKILIFKKTQSSILSTQSSDQISNIYYFIQRETTLSSLKINHTKRLFEKFPYWASHISKYPKSLQDFDKIALSEVVFTISTLYEKPRKKELMFPLAFSIGLFEKTIKKCFNIKEDNLIIFEKNSKYSIPTLPKNVPIHTLLSSNNIEVFPIPFDQVSFFQNCIRLFFHSSFNTCHSIPIPLFFPKEGIEYQFLQEQIRRTFNLNSLPDTMTTWGKDNIIKILPPNFKEDFLEINVGFEIKKYDSSKFHISIYSPLSIKKRPFLLEFTDEDTFEQMTGQISNLLSLKSIQGLQCIAQSKNLSGPRKMLFGAEKMKDIIVDFSIIVISL